MLNYSQLREDSLRRRVIFSLFFIFFITHLFSLETTNQSNEQISNITPYNPDSRYITQWDIRQRVFTNAYLDEERNTNILIYTNVSIERVPMSWELTQFYTAIISNTNIVTLINTNLIETNTVTNFVITTTNLPFFFHDPFQPLIDITPAKSYEDLQQSILDLLLPPYLYQLTPQEGPLQKKMRQANTEFLQNEDLLAFDEDLYNRLMYKEKNKRLTFTPEEAQHLTIGFEEWDTKIVIRGTINLKMGYGLAKRDENNPIPVAVQNGFTLNQLMKVNVTGWFGERIKVNIDQDSQRENNLYDIGFEALKTDYSILRELKVGNITLNIPQSSQYLRYSGTSESSIGIKAVLAKNAFTWQTVLNLTRTQKGYKKFTGNSQLVNLTIQDFQFFKRKYFILPDTSIDLGSLEVLKFTSSTNTADRRVNNIYYNRLLEGKDYYINLSTGELNLNQSLSRDQNLIISYTHGGSFISTNTNTLVGLDDQSGERFVYLWRSDMNFSQYIHYGVYSLQTSDFDASRGFSLQVYKTEDSSQLSSTQFTPSDYEINSIQGLIRFKSPTPFPDVESQIYFGADDPVAGDSKNLMKIQLNKTLKRYVLDFGVIAGSEQVYVNGRLLGKGEYTLISALGELLFNNPALINESDTIEVYYEFQPFFAASQRFGIASRLDYKPSNIFNIGSTILYGVNQRPSGGAPTIFQTPDGSFMGDIDSSLNLSKLLGLNDNWVMQIKGEFALSLLDKNTSGYAIIDDFENAGDIFNMSINETRWILAAPTTNIPGMTYANRGQLLYKDYRNYKLDGSYTVLTYNSLLDSSKIKDYSVKPGPYLVLGGHLDPSDYPQVSQSSLTFDYDFSSGNWVGAAISIAGPSGQDFTRYNRVVFWYKVENDENGDGIFEDTGNQEVEIFFGLGLPNEDSDGDGVFDGEIDRGQAGYPFNNFLTPAVVDTWVGVGRLGEGDGFVQSEDLNQDESMSTNDNQVIFPSVQGYTDITNANLQEGGWKRMSISISSLSSAQKAILQHVSALTVYIRQKNGVKGRVILDELQFKEVKWEDKRVDGIRAQDSTAINGELIGVYNNNFYSANRFYNVSSSVQQDLDRSVVFEHLHGTRTINEALQYNENTLALEYRLTNSTVNTNVFPITGGEKASLIEYTSSPFDISRYKELTFYMYVPDVQENGQPIKTAPDSYSNENFFFILGNSQQSYFQWNIPLSEVDKNTWHKITVKIDDNLKLMMDDTNLNGTLMPDLIGIPNLNDIDFVEMGVELSDTNEAVNNGTVWVNELHVHNDESVLGTAFYVNPRFEYRKPIWSAGSQEIVGPVFLNTIIENKSVDFVNSIGGSSGNGNKNINLSLRSSLFKDLTYSVSYTVNEQKTETNQIKLPLYLQWNSENRSFNATINFTKNKDFIPSVSHTFTEVFSSLLNRSTVSSASNEYILDSWNKEYKGTVTVTYNHLLPFYKVMKSSKTFSLTPAFTFEDSLVIKDNSNYTNETGQVFLTNNNVYGTKSQSKRWAASLDFKLWKVGLNGSYEKRQEKLDQIFSFQGYRQEILSLENESLAQRYADRWSSIFRFFDFDENLDRQLDDKVSLGFNLNRPVNWLMFDANDSFSRIQSGYTYDRFDVLTYRSDRYNLKNSWNLRILPEKTFFKTLTLKLDRSVDLAYSGLGQVIDSSQALVMGDIYYRNPLYYSAILGGLTSQTNALHAVGNFSVENPQSVNTLIDTLNVELLLPNYQKKIWDMLPKRYTFSSRLYTSRNLSSYSQSIENRAAVRFPIELARLQKPTAPVKLREIFTEVDYRNVTDFNSRQTLDTLGVTFRHGMNFINSNFLVLVYSYSLRVELENYFTNSAAHSGDYGFVSLPPHVSPKKSIYNTLNFKASWEIRNINRLNLGFVVIKLNNSIMKNSEILTFTTQSIFYNGFNFNPYDLKVYDLTLEHITDYKFTEIVSGVFRLKGVLNRYASITPLSTDAAGYKQTWYDIGLGMEVSLDMSIRI